MEILTVIINGKEWNAFKELNVKNGSIFCYLYRKNNVIQMKNYKKTIDNNRRVNLEQLYS